MRYPVYYLNNLVNKIANKETDNINKARIEMLIYILVAYLVSSGILVIAYLVEYQLLQLLRIVFVFITTSFFIVILNKNINSWKIISHIVICLITLNVLGNLTLFVKGVNVATLQYVWLACALGFYMHGLKWGWYYACMNVIPIIVFTAMDSNYFWIEGNAQKISLGSYLFVICYNFTLIIFLHYYFFKAFDSNFIKLTQTKDELKSLNNKLNETLEDLERLSSSRMDFFSVMSHELRTPMNGVIGITNALLLQTPPEDQKEDLAVLKFSAENLLSLINDILDFNKLDAGMIALEQVDFDLARLVENNFATFSLKAKEKKLDFKFFIDEQLIGKTIISDPGRITQVLLNLLNNAIKFTPKGYVNLSVKVLSKTNDLLSVRFLVEDTGIGIAENNQKEIFEAFVQASSNTSRYYGGTGLGLPIVKNILEMFNAKIFLESKINEGTKMFFDIDFQYKETAFPDFIETTESLMDISYLDVLVAEDNLVNVLVIKKTLKRWGITPVIAENGIIALEKLKSANFDVILMDLYMPEMDGFETSMAIRSLPDPVKSKIPIIAFTATVNNDTARKVAECGMNDFLPKPFNPQHLCNKLEQIVRNNL